MNRSPRTSDHQPTGLAPAPVVIRCATPPHPRVAARAFADLPHLLLLESAMRHESLGRYSFLTADPVLWFDPEQEHQEIGTTFDWLDRQLASFTVESHVDLPPFQGGVAGLFGYEFNAAIEQIRATRSDTPAVALGVYDVVIAWDHQQDACWIISQGFPERDAARRMKQADERAREFVQRIESVQSAPVETRRQAATTINRDELASNFTRDQYLQTIKQALDYIHAGDVFQVNIAQQLTHPATAGSLELYAALAACNPATFAGYLDVGDSQVISASPERLLAVRGRHVETRPIKGTRRRTLRPEVDLAVGSQLKSSPKDRAENVMIVDLMRNDLSRICADDSVCVSQFVELESYASVLHLVSAVEGELRDDVTPSNLLRAVFPGGSITGAPKVRAMEIIADLEPTPRGAYCGSLGYFGFDGSIDFNILIRTITAQHEKWHIPVGGGIVADSDPVTEYEETWTKAFGMLQALEQLVACQNTGSDTRP
ncbi:MAG: aminodeoxychorismate synthase component I [Pirellulaceae bacterium]